MSEGFRSIPEQYSIYLKSRIKITKILALVWYTLKHYAAINTFDGRGVNDKGRSDRKGSEERGTDED